MPKEQLQIPVEPILILTTPALSLAIVSVSHISRIFSQHTGLPIAGMADMPVLLLRVTSYLHCWFPSCFSLSTLVLMICSTMYERLFFSERKI